MSPSPRGNELECVAANVNVRYRLLNSRHMAADALGAGRTYFVMRVFLNGSGVRTIRGIRPMALEAHDTRRF